MRLEPTLRWLVYTATAVLFATGVAWWLLDAEADRSVRFYLIAVHGFAAMVFLGILGAVIALHVAASWRKRRNRWSGTFVGVLAGLLAVTAYGLYYAGSDTLRGTISDIHLAAGILLALLLVTHIAIGRMTRPGMDGDPDDME